MLLLVLINPNWYCVGGWLCTP